MSRLPACCFGKLPIHGDFVRHNVPTPEIDVLDQWIQGGILSARQTLGASWEASFDATPPGRFLYQPVAGGRTLAGVVTASRDRTGRRFPFLLFTVVPPAELGVDTAVIPFFLADFLDRAERFAVSGWQGKDLRTFLAEIDALVVEGDPAAARKACGAFVSGLSNEAFWTGKFGSAGDARKYLLVHNLVDILAPGSRPRFALRLPCGTGEEVAFWLELARRVGARKGLPTWTLWGGGRNGAPAGTTFVFDELLSKYFLPVFWPEREHDLLYPLAGDGQPSEARVRQARERYAPLLDDGAMRLSTLLLRLTGS